MILVSIEELGLTSISLFTGQSGADFGPPLTTRNNWTALDCCGRGDLVEGGVGNVECLDLRSSVDYFPQDLCHFCVACAIVGFRILCSVPQTDSERFRSARGNKRDFVLEPILFPKQGNNFLLQPLGELGNAIGLQMQVHSACKRGQPPWLSWPR